MTPSPTISKPVYKLYCFDVDGTLIDEAGNLLRGVQEQFALFSVIKPAPFIAFCSNQGGVGLKFWMGKDNFGDPQYMKKLPTSYEILRVHQELAQRLTPLPVLCLQAYAYQSKKSGLWSPSPIDADRINDHPAWLPEWRKPSPGMILEAMKRIHTTAAETIMIGNANEDYEAAARAGVSFAWADSFFGRAEGRNGNTD